MAHRIIIGRAINPSGGADHHGVEYEVTYSPEHGLSLEEQIKRTGKLQRLCAKIEAVVAGDESE